MTTVHVPYTYLVPVPTYGMMPVSGFGSAPTVGFGSSLGFGSAPSVGFGSSLGFGGIQTAGFGGNIPTPGFGGNGGNINEATLRAFLAAATKSQPKETGFGSAPAGDEGCKKELAELSAQVEKIRIELTEFKKTNISTNEKLTEAIVKIAETLNAHTEKLNDLNKKVGKGFDNKSLSETLIELNTRLDQLKTNNPTLK